MRRYCRLKKNLASTYEVLHISSKVVVTREGHYTSIDRVVSLLVLADVKTGDVETAFDYDVVMIMKE